MRSPSENFQCVVPENIHTLPREGIGIFREGGVSKAQECKAMYEGKLEILEEWQIASVGGGGGVWILCDVEVHNNLPWGAYGYFLEPHVTYLLYTSFNQSSMNWSYIEFPFTN